jgi:hypothetical protein
VRDALRLAGEVLLVRRPRAERKLRRRSGRFSRQPATGAGTLALRGGYQNGGSLSLRGKKDQQIGGQSVMTAYSF